eukprot:gene43285-18344_t
MTLGFSIAANKDGGAETLAEIADEARATQAKEDAEAAPAEVAADGRRIAEEHRQLAAMQKATAAAAAREHSPRPNDLGVAIPANTSPVQHQFAEVQIHRLSRSSGAQSTQSRQTPSDSALASPVAEDAHASPVGSQVSWGANASPAMPAHIANANMLLGL